MRQDTRLRYLLGEIGGYALIYSGIARLFLNWRLSRGEATAFYLHNPDQQVFEKIMTRARAWGFEFVDDTRLLDFIDGRSPSGRSLLHVSVDDGWRDNLRNIVGFAERNQIPITYFICTESTDAGTFWWDRVPDFATASKLRRMSNGERIRYLEGIQTGSATLPLAGDDARRTAMTADEVAALAKMRHATIGNHTHSHPVFARCGDEEIDAELVEAHRRLTDLTGVAPRSFAYPCGSTNGYEQQVLKRLGYQIAYTTEPRGVRIGEVNRYDIPRFEDNRHGGPAENFCRMIGLWETIYHTLRRRYKALKRLFGVKPRVLA